MRYRQSTAATPEAAQAIPVKVASQAQEPSPAAAQASSAANCTDIPSSSHNLPLRPGQSLTARPDRPVARG
jgi:hypothetical protein